MSFPLHHPKPFSVHPLVFFQIETPTLLQVPSWYLLSLSIPHPSSLSPCTHPHCPRATVLNFPQFLKQPRLVYFHHRPSHRLAIPSRTAPPCLHEAKLRSQVHIIFSSKKVSLNPQLRSRAPGKCSQSLFCILFHRSYHIVL